MVLVITMNFIAAKNTEAIDEEHRKEVKIGFDGLFETILFHLIEKDITKAVILKSAMNSALNQLPKVFDFLPFDSFSSSKEGDTRFGILMSSVLTSRRQFSYMCLPSCLEVNK